LPGAPGHYPFREAVFFGLSLFISGLCRLNSVSLAYILEAPYSLAPLPESCRIRLLRK
jgi:hypothetical protein